MCSIEQRRFILLVQETARALMQQTGQRMQRGLGNAVGAAELARRAHACVRQVNWSHRKGVEVFVIVRKRGWENRVQVPRSFTLFAQFFRTWFPLRAESPFC